MTFYTPDLDAQEKETHVVVMIAKKICHFHKTFLYANVHIYYGHQSKSINFILFFIYYFIISNVHEFKKMYLETKLNKMINNKINISKTNTKRVSSLC